MHETNTLLPVGHLPVRQQINGNGSKTFSLLSFTTKMPGPSWSIPAKECQRGSILRNLENSVCSKCYALKNRYIFSNVQHTLTQRLLHYHEDPQAWVQALINTILAADCQHFRWFDSGDLQSIEMVFRIFDVCEGTPNVKHWLPTREKSILKEALKHINIPPNLTIRISATYIDQAPPKISKAHEKQICTSTVVTEGSTCPAPEQGNQCLSCRKCWDRSVANVAYSLH